MWKVILSLDGDDDDDDDDTLSTCVIQLSTKIEPNYINVFYYFQIVLRKLWNLKDYFWYRMRICLSANR